ncbi:MAG: hypothetical protein GY731_11615, partial [Gammaproteobacteria bacterium]|nr:hypothetical protein [Gammaproteobacteria bacterium]
MIAAARLIGALRSHLNVELVVPSLSIGVAEPSSSSGLPAVVISLVQLVNPSKGLGEHRQVKYGALSGSTQVNLSNPVLPDDTSVEVLSEDRLTLSLFHGGLVDADGSDTPLQASDIQVELDGVPFTIVVDTPAAGEFSVDTEMGQLTFGGALPADGLLQADYFIGQWERVVHQLQGMLRIASVAGNNADAESLSNQVYDALAMPGIQGLRDLEVVNMGSVTAFSESP